MAVGGGYTCYATYYQLARKLPTEEQQGRFWVALNAYLFEDIDMEDELDELTAFAFICAKAHARTSLKQAENGRKKAKEKPKRSQTKANGKPNESQKGTSLSLSQRQINKADGAAFQETAPPACPNCGSACDWDDAHGWWECRKCVAVVA